VLAFAALAVGCSTDAGGATDTVAGVDADPDGSGDDVTADTATTGGDAIEIDTSSVGDDTTGSSGDTVTPDATDPCEDVVCDAAPVCKANPRCTAASAPECVYDDLPDGDVCELAGGGDGFCDGGACLPPQACSVNADCGPNACIAGICALPSGLGGACDSGDGDDCETDHVCVAGVCYRAEGQPCGGNEECAGYCTGVCDDGAGPGESCEADSCRRDLDCMFPEYVCYVRQGEPCAPGECAPDQSCDAVKGTCVRSEGGCQSNAGCEAICVEGGCWPELSEYEFPCDIGDDEDCAEGLACAEVTFQQIVFGVCLLADGGDCSGEQECAGRCIAGVCEPLSPLGGACATTEDCAAGVCAGSICLLPNGAACTSNEDCVETCIGGVCGPRVGYLSTCDDPGDCQTDMTCSESDLRCRLADGAPCQSAIVCDIGSCIAGVCKDTLSGDGEACLGTVDCEAGLECRDALCQVPLLPNGESCTSDEQCINTCIGGTCADRLGLGASCEVDGGDCAANLACVANAAGVAVCRSADPGVCMCRVFQNQCLGVMNDDCNPGWKEGKSSPCSCFESCECVPD